MGIFLAKRAIILYEGVPGPREMRLGRILDFFGVPWNTVDFSRPGKPQGDAAEYVVFGSATVVAAALKQNGTALAISQPAAFYSYIDDNRDRSISAHQLLFGNPSLSLEEAPAKLLPLSVSGKLPDITGPMAGLNVSVRLGEGDALLSGASAVDESTYTTIIAAGGFPVFLRFQQKDIPIFSCTSSRMIDINQPVGAGFYDVKDHFCSVVPLIMFIRFMFPEVSWRPQELGACLIIDDPLLRLHYGFCDFPKLRDLMRRHGFTTNIAFIPWNWRRTSSSASDFFRNESELFSVSVHGCDHTAGEFGTMSSEILATRARLARWRMQNHEARTGIRHDSIMVFPQGAFSSLCPPVLQRNNFLAAVNTEMVPVDSRNARTRIRDAWDIAITAYGGFPIFVRRYPFHGIENFAFDLLLGKPCLIVAHHQFFRDGGTGLIELIEQIKSLNCSLRWRQLGDVVRRACRRRVTGTGAEEIEMYASELLLGNPSDRPIDVKIRKKKGQDDLVSEISCDGKPIEWSAQAEHYIFGERIRPHSEQRFRVLYREQPSAVNEARSLRFELSVAARRALCEFRDDYLSRSRLLWAPANKLGNVLRKAI
jgi:hypothetical protein